MEIPKNDKNCRIESTHIKVKRTNKHKQTLKKHEQTLNNRVLHMVLSPDGKTVASAAADETLRFWKVFDYSGKINTTKNKYKQTQTQTKTNK